MIYQKSSGFIFLLYLYNIPTAAHNTRYGIGIFYLFVFMNEVINNLMMKSYDLQSFLRFTEIDENEQTFEYEPKA